MIEVVGDLWEQQADCIVITTNGVVKPNGELVMGAGCALQAANRYPGIARTLGGMVRTGGNRVHLVGYNPAVVSFPTKHHWRDDSDLDLIRQSLTQLVNLVTRLEYFKVVMTRPGCGNGRLWWPNVRMLLEHKLDDRFTVVSGR